MKNLFGLAAVALLGCGGIGPPGPTGPRGAQGPQGPSGVSPALIWRNPAGAIIAYGDPPMHKDGDGHWWFVHTDTGDVDLIKQPTSRVVFPSTDCTGPSFYVGPIVLAASLPRPPFFPPRVPFFVDSENGWRVRSDAAGSQMLNILSALQVDGSCGLSNLPNLPVLPSGMASSSQTTMPNLGMTGPIHMETFQD